MADTEYNAEEAAELKKKRTFRKFSYRGIDLEAYVIPELTAFSANAAVGRTGDSTVA